MSTTNRAALIKLLRSNPALINTRRVMEAAADMLEADGKVLQELEKQNPDVKPSGPAELTEQFLVREDAVILTQQDPVAFICHGHLYKWPSEDEFCGNPEDHIPLYAAPQPQRPRLTDEEIDAVISEHRCGMSYDFYPAYRAVSRAIEKKVRGEA